jgi:NadR type nicotinamide-nucleotide adenylyltransferase
MAPCVRAYYARRICLLGAESTGKTTLAAALARRFQTVWVPEYARAYLEAGRPLTEPAHFEDIARGQVESEDKLAREANRLLFCDTNLLATQVWCEHYAGSCPNTIATMAASRTYDLYLLCDVAGMPWVADSIRDCPDLRTTFHDRFRRELEERRLPYVVLTGSFAERLKTAIASVEPVLKPD